MLNRTISITEEQWDKVEATMVKYNLNFNEAVRKIIEEHGNILTDIDHNTTLEVKRNV